MLYHLLEHGPIEGRDAAGRTIIQLAVDDRTLERLMTFDADLADLKDEVDDEPDAGDEEDGPRILVAASGGDGSAWPSSLLI